ncbi:hypothetical protein Taro_049469 [Colocasia esculenta]|uniref:D-isomer specific 2-hydroxyacid dehydrogenase catalytic domain-containing protein n=1 Tax=Colocasia esculenta TaxID=4460 RepID=A0A843XB26_COLES|nr:hypothetical protein [Colocasia esculenta]
MESEALAAMATFGVLLTCPMDAYLESELEKRFRLLRLWETPPDQRERFLSANAGEIRAVVGNTAVGADAGTIELLPRLEIVSSFSVGLDKVDLARCREKGIRVTNTPDVLTDDVADLAVGLAIAVLRRICAADGYVRSGAWKRDGDYRLTSQNLVVLPKEHTSKELGNSGVVSAINFSLFVILAVRDSLEFKKLLANAFEDVEH